MGRSARQPDAPVVSVINMKGGVGKTTLAGNLFREVFRTKSKRTLLVDFDPQVNLSQLLFTRSDYDDLRDQAKTLWSVMEPKAPTSVFAVSAANLKQVENCGDYVYSLRYLTKTPEVQLNILAGDFRLALLNLREDRAALETPRARFRSFIDHARREYDLIVLDCNPSSSFLTKTALEVSSHTLIPVRPDKYSILGLEMLTEYISSFPGLVAPKRSIIVNGTTDNADADQVVRELRAHSLYGPDTLVTSIPHTRVLAARSDYTGFAVDRGVANCNRTRDYLQKAANELCSRVGLN